MFSLQETKHFATEIRKKVISMVYKGKCAHVGSNFSIVDIVAVLYENILKKNPSDPNWKERDRFILSKGHACACVYAALALKGFFSLEWLDTYYQNGGHLAGHMTSSGVPGVEFSTGSLGHGLPVGCGMALSAKRDHNTWKVYVILSDGECDEGSNWEAAMFAAHHKLDNLIVIIDFNNLQSLATVEDTLGLEPIVEKWKSFGWSVHDIDGHNHQLIFDTLQKLPFEKEKPHCIVARTIKGKGVSFMENKVNWHYQNPNGDQFSQALQEIERCYQ